MPSLSMLNKPTRLGTDELKETVDLSYFEARETIPANLEETARLDELSSRTDWVLSVLGGPFEPPEMTIADTLVNRCEKIADLNTRMGGYRTFGNELAKKVDEQRQALDS